MKLRECIHIIVEPRNEDKWSLCYDYVMLIAIIIGIVPLMFRIHTKLFIYMDIISGLCYIVDYVLRWCTADISSQRGKKLAFFLYPFTPMAIIDLMSILPLFHLLAPTFKIARISRLLKIIRVLKIIRYFEPFEVVVAVIGKQRKVLCTVLSLAIFYTFVTALIMFNAGDEIDPATGKHLFENFFDAFYWAACTLTTVGYGDLYPISDMGRIISIISAMVGIAIIALPSGIITAGYMDELNNRKKKRKEA